MNPTIQKIIDQIPGWNKAQNLAVNPQKGGLTNANYLVEVDGEKYVLRVSGKNTEQLGINRQTEYEAVQATSQAGISPQVIHFSLTDGHMVTRFIEGQEWGIEEFKDPAVIRRVSKTMKRVHALTPISGAFSPYRDIEQRLEIANRRGVAIPDRMESFLEKLTHIERDRSAHSNPKLCHNDPFSNNFLYNDQVYLLDWEFAGMGDIFFDLAAVSYFFNQNQRDYLLECYFGEVTQAASNTLNDLWYVVAFWNATWQCCKSAIRTLISIILAW